MTAPGSAYESQVPERRNVRAFVCRQFKKQDVLWASEIQGIRAFGSESETQQVQAEVARRLRRLRSDAEATFEFHLLNGIQGRVRDPRDGATVIDYFTEFAITPAPEVDLDLDNAAPGPGALRKACQALIEDVEDSLGGLSTGAVPPRAGAAPAPSCPPSSPPRAAPTARRWPPWTRRWRKACPASSACISKARS